MGGPHDIKAGESSPAYRDPGDPPDLDWIDPNLIDVDSTYQRDLDELRVQRILEWFSWSSFGALTVVPKDGGRFNATDGQHRLEAAKRHPDVSMVPCVIPKLSGTVAEATNFVSLNAERKNVTPLQLYWAQLAAEDGEAVTVANVCQRAGHYHRTVSRRADQVACERHGCHWRHPWPHRSPWRHEGEADARHPVGRSVRADHQPAHPRHRNPQDRG